MSRTFSAFAWSIVLSSCSPSVADDPRSRHDDRPPTEWVADPRWQPTPGYRVNIPSDHTPAARTSTAWDAYEASRAANDVVGIDRAYSSGDLIKLSRGTGVHVIRDHAPPRMGNGTLSAEAFASSRLNARPAVSPDGFPVEVRILDGPHADRLAFVSRKDIARLVERRVIPILNPGDRATVAGPESFIAADHNDLHDLKFARFDGDSRAITGLLRSGKLAKLNGGAKVVVLGTDGEFARVRVHSGTKLAGNTGYVPSGDLIPPARATTPAARQGPAIR